MSESDLLATLSERWTWLRDRVSAAAKKAARSPGEIQILPVSKGQSVELVSEALTLPEFPRRLGENYLEELSQKAAALPDDLEWNYQGRLQSRKIAKIAAMASVIQTVAREKELSILAEEMRRQSRTLDFFVQVNISAEGQKNGCEPADLPRLLETAEKFGVFDRCLGLMCLPSSLDAVDESKLRREFELLRGLRDRHLPRGSLSMGTSYDFEIAIEEGADWIRVGSRLFGERDKRV